MSFKVVPFPFPLPEHEGSSLWYLLWKPGLVSGYRSHKTVRVPIWLIPPLEFLTLRLDCTEQPIIISYYSIGCHGSVCSWVTALVNWCSLYLPICLSNLKGSCLRCVLTSLKDPRRVVDFPDCSVFYLLLGWSGDFQASPMQNGNLEVQLIILTSWKMALKLLWWGKNQGLKAPWE